MTLTDGKPVQCPCCKECKDCTTNFQKVVDLKNAGLVIYRHTTRTEDLNKDTGIIEFASNVTEDVFILHNTKDTEITPADYLPEIEQNTIYCPRCRKIIKHAQKLIQKVPLIKRNDLMGICEHCRAKDAPCFECEEVVRKFVATKPERTENTNERVTQWLSKIKHLLKDASVVDGTETGRERFQAHSNLYIDQLSHETPKSGRELKIKQMFPSSKEKSSNMFTQLEKLDRPLVFLDLSGKERKPSTSKAREEIYVPARYSVYVLDTEIEDLRAMFITPLPEKYKEKKEKRVELREGVLFKSEQKFIIERDESKTKLQTKSIRKSRYASDEEPDTTLFVKTGKETLKSKIPQRSQILPADFASERKHIEEFAWKKTLESRSIIRKYHSEEGLLTAITGVTEDLIKQDFSYVFPKMPGIKKQERQKSSSELIKDTQHKVAKAEKERKLLEEELKKKLKEEERKRIALEKKNKKKQPLVDKDADKKEKVTSKKKPADEDALKAEKADKEKRELEKQNRLKQEKAEQEKLDLEKQNRLKQEKAEKEKLELEKQNRLKLEREERAQMLKTEKEEQLLKEKQLRDKLAQEKADANKQKRKEKEEAMEPITKEIKSIGTRVKPNRLSNMNLTTKDVRKHKIYHKSRKSDTCIMCQDSDIELDAESLDLQRDKGKTADIIIGPKIFKWHSPLKDREDELADAVPLLFQTTFLDTNAIAIVATSTHFEVEKQTPGKQGQGKSTEPESPKGVVRYALSDRSFIDKGWTMLPIEKVVKKLNVYRMRPAHPEFNWFQHNKNKRQMLYDSGEKLAEFDDKGRGRWFYKNGRVALDYYDAEELNAQQRFVVYSSGDPDERGRAQPYTLLATFDYLGNGIVFDHSGKIRLKYNQTEGVVLDRSIGPVSHWKWHTLNDPPVLQQVMIDTQMAHKDPNIMNLDPSRSGKTRHDDEEMLAIEFDNFIKEKSKKMSQTFKPFQITMKALKMNEQFSLKVLDQATVYLVFRAGTTNLKLNIGMVLDPREIVDTETSELGDVSNNMDKLPARTDSLARLQKSIAHAQHYDRSLTERDRRIRRSVPRGSADALTAAASCPLRPGPSGFTTPADSYCKCSRRPFSGNVYYDSRLC